MGNRPLEGIRVLDLTQAYSGPFCTMNLADQGAEVIKIEVPGAGDQTRGWGPIKNDVSGYYSYVNRNKKGMTLNLKSEAGKKIFTELLKTADVVCENYKVGVLTKLGFPYEKMKEINPHIIYGSISGFGTNGPLKDHPAYDIVAQAMSGMMSVTGFSDNPPTKIGPSIGDNYSGAYLCMGILMALYNREKTGEGARIDVAMMDTLFSVMENMVMEYTVLGHDPMRNGNADPAITPFDCFHAKDGDFVMGCGTDKLFITLADAMGKSYLYEDPRFDNNWHRTINYNDGLKEEIEEFTTKKTIQEMEDLLVELKIPFGRINTVGQATEHPQIAARNMIWTVDQPGIGEIRMPGCPIKIQGKPDEIRKCAPELGGDNETILESLGYSAAEIASFKENGAI